MNVKITVTAADIGAGKPHSCEKCPVALAIVRAGFTPDVDGDEIGLWDKAAGWWRFGAASDAVIDFVVAFDRGRPVEPFEFDLDVPDGLLPAGAPS